MAVLQLLPIICTLTYIIWHCRASMWNVTQMALGAANAGNRYVNHIITHLM